MRGPLELPPARTWHALIELALAEDVGPGDVTTTLVVGADQTGTGLIEARQDLVVCGLPVAAATFAAVDPELRFEATSRDAETASAGDVLARVHGSMRSLLTGERAALNFLMRMCGVATATRRYVDAVRGTRARIVDTRKTLPGWRALDKYATAAGGGENHRVGLYDGILLKDNHIALAGGVAAAVKAAISGAPAGMRVQVEVESEAQAQEAVDAGADFLLLDNCDPDVMTAIARRLGSGVLLEASGGVSLDNVREIAETGVSRISIGALTHSAPAADVALEIAEPSGESPRGRVPA